MQLEIGSIVEGKISGILKFGVFVDIDGGGSGLVHISEIASCYVNDIAEHVQKDQRVKVKVIGIAEDGKVSLSIKKASPEEKPKFTNKPSYTNKPSTYAQKPSVYTPKSNAPKSTGNAFEDMLNSFIKCSDEKIADSKKNSNKESRRARTKGRNS